MSSWTFTATVNIDKLMQIAGRLNTIPAMLDEIGEQTVTTIKQNITNVGAVDTGAMRDSIAFKPIQDGIILHDNVTYGIYNEFGTYMMEARPFFIPAVEKIGEIIEQKFTELIR